MSTIIAFNTGRTYTESGQRIAAALLDNGDIVFNDIDRRVSGTICANGLTLEDVLAFGEFTKRGVMAAYDANNYSQDADADLLDQLRAAAGAL
jgi:hypothetical protein